MSEMALFAAVACASAGVFGFCLAVMVHRFRLDVSRQQGLRDMVRQAPRHAKDPSRNNRLPPTLRAVERESVMPHSPWLRRFAESSIWGFGLKDSPSMLARAGLAETANSLGIRIARIRLTCVFAILGGGMGSLFSFELAMVLVLVGAMLGFRRIPACLRSAAAARNTQMERHLSEMLEVVVLGLRSGLSFERSFSLYPHYFETDLACSMTRVSERWDAGLMTREEALRLMEQEYDSPLLARVVSSMVRSLRFGTSIAESLEATAVEAREMHRARMEERVAKVAVKMMLPVGTLILPAMLLLVLGPVMLELVEGF